MFGIPALLFLLFPDGRPLSRRWRPAVVLTAVGLACQAAAAALADGPMEDSPVPGVANPVAVSGPVVPILELAGWTLTLGAIVLATVSLVLRYRRSSGHERLQLRWVASSAVLFGVTCLASAMLFQTELGTWGQLLVLVAFNTIPIAAGVAILRHRLVRHRRRDQPNPGVRHVVGNPAGGVPRRRC